MARSGNNVLRRALGNPSLNEDLDARVKEADEALKKSQDEYLEAQREVERANARLDQVNRRYIEAVCDWNENAQRF